MGNEDEGQKKAKNLSQRGSFTYSKWSEFPMLLNTPTGNVVIALKDKSLCKTFKLALLNYFNEN